MKKTKVEMLVTIGGGPEPKYGLNDDINFTTGEVVELHPELAKLWIAGGHAKLVEEEEEGEEGEEEPDGIETAELDSPEKAVRPGPRRKYKTSLKK